MLVSKVHSLKKKLLFVDAQWINNTATEDGTKTRPISKAGKNRMILRKFKENARAVLEHSNATPIKGHWGIGYGCAYCKYQNPSAPELKAHTLLNHSPDTFDNNVKYVSDMIVKIDITNLQCLICHQHIDSLDNLMIHLNQIHQKTIHFDINNHIIPFKFDKDFLECAVCPLQFNHFKQLGEHMNKHYSNYECPECKQQFINNRSLKSHSNRHQTGVFVCSYCSKIFDTRVKMREHERVLHLRGSKTRKCGYCEERFMDPVKKAEHEVKVHGAAAAQYDCKACGKSFDSRRSLKGHTDHFHLLLRPHKCSHCGKGFYNQNELKRHLVKHTRVKEFQCEVCSKRFGARSTLKVHMKIHENDRPFRCDRCGQMFIQKTSWVVHLQTKHPDIIVN